GGGGGGRGAGWGSVTCSRRRYLAALRAAAAKEGVRHLTGTVTRVTGGEAILGDGRRLTAASVVIAGGWATSKIDGVPDEIRKALRPVKGQILRLRHPPNMPHIATRSIRAVVGGRDRYLVPPTDRDLLAGAPQ